MNDLASEALLVTLAEPRKCFTLIPWLTLGLLFAMLGGIGYGYYYYVYDIQFPDFYNYYGLLAKSFMEGHTYLDIRPTQQLLALPNPYDSRISHNMAMWDASLYDGKYYLYFGAVPALVLWIPVKYLFDFTITAPMAVLGFTILGTSLLCFFLAMFTVKQKTLTHLALIICVVSISFGCWTPFMLRRSSFYEVAVSGGYFFSATGLFLLWRSFSAKGQLYWMAAASLCFGLAVGCRPTHLFNALFLAAAWLVGWRVQPVKKFLCLSLPWLTCIGGIMIYNYVRFDSPFEPGIHYQITILDAHVPGFHLLRPERFIPNIWYYLLRPIDWLPQWKFPFVKVTYYNVKMLPWNIRAESYEPLYGLFSNCPFSLFIFAGMYCFWRKRKELSREALAMMASITLFTLCVLTYLLFCIFTTMRYTVDFAPWFMLVASMYFMWMLQITQSKKARFFWLVVGSLATAYGVFVSSMAGYCGQFLCSGMS